MIEFFKQCLGLSPLGDMSYLNSGRLADVLALIQVLALDEYAHRSEDGLREELQGNPKSGCSWACVAQQHPELFRVRDGGDNCVSLLARNSRPQEANGRRTPLSDGFTRNLLSTAVEMHDAQLKRSQRLMPIIPLYVACLTSFTSVIVASIAACAAYFKH